MISLVVALYRPPDLARLLASWAGQEWVDELVLVLNGLPDQDAGVIDEIARRHPALRVRMLRNPRRCSLAHCRNAGARAAQNAYVLFCNEDTWLEPGYARACLIKLLSTGAGAVSGRRVTLQGHEGINEAIERFGHGLRRSCTFRRLSCTAVDEAWFAGDVRQPGTHPVILTHRHLVQRYPFDCTYLCEKADRSARDFQMNLFINGYCIVVTNDARSVRLPQTAAHGTRLAHTWQETRHFYRKHYERYASRVAVRAPRWLAALASVIDSIWRDKVLAGPGVIAGAGTRGPSPAGL